MGLITSGLNDRQQFIGDLSECNGVGPYWHLTMTNKNKKLNSMTHDLRAEMLIHARKLHLKDLNGYKEWCRANGFQASLRKSQPQRKRELDLFRRKTAEARLKRYKKESNLGFQIKQIFAKQIAHQHVQNDALREIAKGLKHCAFPKLLLETLVYLESKTKFIEDPHCVKGIIGLVNHRTKWIRPLVDWNPTTHNTDRQFASLLRHLLANYQVPGFMDSAWLQGNAIQQSWFIHIGAGKNIRTARSLPVAMTKKMAHYFLLTPHHYPVNSAFRWAQIRAIGGHTTLTTSLCETRLVRNFRDNEFWLSVFCFFIANPMMDLAHVNPIVDFIWNQKYENRIEFVARGVAREIGPAHPNFSMRGRTPETLMRQVENWHRQLGQESRGGNLQWRKSKISDYRFVEGNTRRSNMKSWSIRELLSSKELIAEGRAQNHCVASYARSCFVGNNSIWTLDRTDSGGTTKMVTIELALPTQKISQIRGKRNRLPTAAEMDVIRRWANKENLVIQANQLQA